MKRQHKIVFVGGGVLSLLLAGCYTQLMTPDQYMSSQSDHPVVRVNASTNLQYSSNCLSCHSSSELDDRYYDMQAYGVVSAHGYRIDPSMWATTEVPVYDPPYFPEPGVPISPWWLPPPVIITGGTQDAGTTPQKKRADNPSRGTDASRDRSSSPVYSSPPAGSGGSSGTPAVQSAPPATSVSSPAQSTPPPQSTESRDRGTSSSSPAPSKKRGD